MTPYFVFIVTLVAAGAAATAAFYRPERVFMRSAIAAACALGAPFIIAYAAAPLLGEGAGMGVAFILYALSAAGFSPPCPLRSAPLPDTYGRICVAESHQTVRHPASSRDATRSSTASLDAR